MLGKLFTFLPGGEVVCKVSLMSALFAFVSLTPVYWTVLLLHRGTVREVNRMIIPASGLLPVFFHTFYSQRNIQVSLGGLMGTPSPLPAAPETTVMFQRTLRSPRT